ncbi:hypothetical protein PAMA_012805 [Pampus argenteus]
MSYLWICFSVLYAATILQSSATDDDSIVSLKCDDTVEVIAGENLTLNCSIILPMDCEGSKYHWRTLTYNINCSSGLMEYTCDWDNLTYVYLTISNVSKEQNYTIKLLTNCGFSEKSIKVRVKPKEINEEDPISAGSSSKVTKPPQSRSYVMPIVLSIVLTLGLLYFLFGTGNGREIIRSMKEGNTRKPAECC